MEPWAAMVAESVGVNSNFGLSAWQQSGIDIHTFGQQRIKSQIIKRHQARLHHIQQMFKDPEHDRFASTRAYSTQVKPTSEVPAPPALGDCTSIAVTDLQRGTTHRGRVLRGVLVVDACFTGSVDTVVEDQAGDCVQVCVYDHPDVETGPNFQHNLATARKVFARGSAIAILEPYYKLVADGSYAVRVENPAEVIFLDKLGPSDLAGWQQEAKKCFQAKQYKDAAAAYGKALHLMQQTSPTGVQQAASYSSSSSNDGSLLLQLLLNTSAACHNLQANQQSLAYAAAAVVFSNQESSKAYYRLALAVDAQAAAAAAVAAAGGSDRAQAVKGAPRALADIAIAFMSRSADLASSVKPAADRQKLFAKLATYSDSSNSNNSGGSRTQDLAAAWAAVCRIIGPAVLCLLQQSASHATAQHNRVAAMAASSSTNNGTDTAAAVPGSGSSTAAELKEFGNAAFRTADYQTALGHYQAALHHSHLQDIASQAAVLLSNRSACYLQLGEQPLQMNHLQQACLNAAAAVLLNSSNIKGWYRWANALRQLTLLQGAVDVCSFALRMHPNDCDLQQLHRLIPAISDGSTARNSNNSSTNCSSSSNTASRRDKSSSHSIKNRRNISLSTTGNSNSGNNCHDEEPR